EGPRALPGTEQHELGRRAEHVEKHRATADRVQTRLLGSEQRTSPSRRAGVQVRRTEVAFGRLLGDDEPAPSAFPLPRHHTAHRKGSAAVEQLPFPRPGLRHRFDEHLHLSLAPHAQVPRGDLVGAGAVAAELGPSGTKDLQRHLAHILLETPTAHVARGAAILGDEQLRSFVTVRRAAHPHDGRERGAPPPRPGELRQAVEYFPGFEPLFHGLRTLSAGGEGAQRGNHPFSFSRATVGVANPGRGKGGRPRCARARFKASSMLPWTFSSPSSSYSPERSSATTGWACTSASSTSVPSRRLRLTSSRSACRPVESIAGTCRSR